MMRVLVLAVLATALVASAAPTEPRLQEVFRMPQVGAVNKVKSILDRVHEQGSMDALSEQDRSYLKSVGFSDADLADPEAEPLRMSDKDTESVESHEIKFSLLESESEVEGGEGWSNTDVTFWWKAFIPGHSCSATSHLDYVALSPVCEGTDPETDTHVLPAPAIFSTSEWFRNDERCWSTDPHASHRIGVNCRLEKKSGGKYRAVCDGSAGETRHYTKADSGCFQVGCERTDHFSPHFESDEFTTMLTFPMHARASNPCSTAAQWTGADIIMNFDITIRIDGSTGSLTLRGSKSQFPAMEGYISVGSGHPLVTWFRWDVGNRTVKSLGLLTKSVDWSPRSFRCNGCH